MFFSNQVDQIDLAGVSVLLFAGDENSYDQKSAGLKMNVDKVAESLYTIRLSLDDSKADWESFGVRFEMPAVDIYSSWSPGLYGNPASIRSKGIAEWHYSYQSMLCYYFPVAMLVNRADINRLSVTCSEQVLPVEVHCGAYEEQHAVVSAFGFHLSGTRREVEFRLDLREISFVEAMKEHTFWLDSFFKDLYPRLESAEQPVYSTWYSFHQNISDRKIENEALFFKEIGFSNLIVDDGWQTEDDRRGYAFCGDWNPACSRFDSFTHHIQKLQEAGLNYFLWLSVPFVGPQSAQWENMKDHLLYFDQENNAGVVDIRSKTVQNFLISKYCELVSEYGLNGLKLDFLDQFILKDADFWVQAEIQLAVESFLIRLKEALLKIEPALLIEFRQRYIGPAMKRFASLFRAHDCPMDPVMNRVHTIDLRLTSAPSIVHSDMIIWNPEESVETAALNLINVLFSVPQISICHKQYPASHLKMIQFWMNYWLENRDLLLGNSFNASRADLQYSYACVSGLDKTIAVIYEPLPFTLYFDQQEIHIINATLQDFVVVDSQEKNKISCEIVDCCGKPFSNKKVVIDKGISVLKIPNASCCKLRKLI